MTLQVPAFLLFAGLSLSDTVPPPKQSAPPRRTAADDGPHQGMPAQISLADLSAADVLLEASPTDKPGAGAVTPSPDSPRGKVVDVALSTSDGQVACAALSVGKLLGGDDRIVLVPATALRYTMIEKNPGYVLRMTKAELESLPEFDIRKDGKEGLDRAVERARGLAADASGRKQQSDGDNKKDNGSLRPKPAESPSASLMAAPSYVLSSQLNGCEFSASDATFGKVHDAVIDVRGNVIGYLLVSRGDSASVGVTFYVVPLRACQWNSASGKCNLKVGKTGDQMKTAPEYKKPEQGLVTSDQMKSADAYFGSGKGGTPNPQ